MYPRSALKQSMTKQARPRAPVHGESCCIKPVHKQTKQRGVRMLVLNISGINMDAEASAMTTTTTKTSTTRATATVTTVCRLINHEDNSNTK